MVALPNLYFKASRGNPGPEILEDVTIGKELPPLQVALHLRDDALAIRSTPWNPVDFRWPGAREGLAAACTVPGVHVRELPPRPKGTPGGTGGWAKLIHIEQWPSPGKAPRVFCHCHWGLRRRTWRLHKRHGWPNGNGSQRVHPTQSHGSRDVSQSGHHIQPRVRGTADPRRGAGPLGSQGARSPWMRSWSRRVRTARGSEPKGHRCHRG